MTSPLKNKQDLLAMLRDNKMRFSAEFEVVNDSGLKALGDRIKSLLRQQKKLRVVLIERP